MQRRTQRRRRQLPLPPRPARDTLFRFATDRWRWGRRPGEGRPALPTAMHRRSGESDDAFVRTRCAAVSVCMAPRAAAWSAGSGDLHRTGAGRDRIGGAGAGGHGRQCRRHHAGKGHRDRQPSPPRRCGDRQPGDHHRPAADPGQRPGHAGPAAAAAAGDGRQHAQHLAQFRLQPRPRAGLAAQSRRRAHPGAGQRPPHGRPGQQRLRRAGRGHQCDPGGDGGTHRGADRRRLLGLRLRCHRRRGQHHPQGQIRRRRRDRRLWPEHARRRQPPFAGRGVGQDLGARRADPGPEPQLDERAVRRRPQLRQDRGELPRRPGGGTPRQRHPRDPRRRQRADPQQRPGARRGRCRRFPYQHHRHRWL